MIAVLTLLATTQLPALTRAKAPVKFTQCQSNCRQIGQGAPCSIRATASANPYVAAWNISPGTPQFRRHDEVTSNVAADGHVAWLRMPPYQPGTAPPSNMLELGDCASGQNPGSTWADNGNRVKLFSRYRQGTGGAAF